MENLNQRQSTIKAIKDIQLILDEMLTLGSNMEVVWRLESLHNQGTILKTANYIRESLDNENNDLVNDVVLETEEEIDELNRYMDAYGDYNERD